MAHGDVDLGFSLDRPTTTHNSNVKGKKTGSTFFTSEKGTDRVGFKFAHYAGHLLAAPKLTCEQNAIFRVNHAKIYLH